MSAQAAWSIASLRDVASDVAPGQPHRRVRIHAAGASGDPHHRSRRRDRNARAVVSEEPKTFVNSWRKFNYDVKNAGKEIVWMSERDGWNHLYLYDGATGRVKNQITKGEWVVRSVVKVDDDKRQIWFTASGMYPGKDPYFTHYYRIDFDGTNLTTLAGGHARESRHLGAARRRLEGAGGLRRQGARRQDRHLGRHHQAVELRSEEEIPGRSRTSTPGRTARSCRRRSGRSARTPRATRSSACSSSPSWASSSCRSTAWGR